MTVRTAELVGARLVDVTGRAVAHVHDLRLVQDGPVHELTGRAAFRVTGLVVGPGHLGMHLGYGSRDVRGPWLLRAPLARLARRARFVPWSEIARIDEGVVHIRCAYDELRSAGEPGERAT